ncbi:MAG: repeat-containing protein [Actinomycetia bacterium]|nr:repeat-containing protein [Actinomycetes bacterium]
METRTADADDAMRFLRELRQLRNEAGLEPAELAARAHYPRDVIVAAEAGPSVPGLPVLSAYVRGCGAGLAEWEERWRSLTGSLAAPAGLPPRPAGCSGLADAGARLSAVVSSNAEVPIPAQVMRLLAGPVEPTPAEPVSAGTTPAGTTAAGTTLPVTAAGAVSHASQLPAVRPAALPATRWADFPRAALAAAVAAVIAVLGAILGLLRRKS